MTGVRCCSYCECRLPVGCRSDKKTCDSTCKTALCRGQAKPAACLQCGGPLPRGRETGLKDFCDEDCLVAHAAGRPSSGDPYFSDPILPGRTPETDDEDFNSDVDALMRGVPTRHGSSDPEPGRPPARERCQEGGIRGSWDSVVEFWRDAQTYRMSQQRMTDDRGRMIPPLREAERLVKSSEGGGGLQTRTVPAGVELAKKIRHCAECGDFLVKSKRGNRCSSCEEAPVHRDERARAVGATLHRLPMRWLPRVVEGAPTERVAV
jgi:hypothetical protein